MSQVWPPVFLWTFSCGESSSFSISRFALLSGDDVWDYLTATCHWRSIACHLGGSIKTGILGGTYADAHAISGSFNSSVSASSSSTQDAQTQYLFNLNSVEACLNCSHILKTTLDQFINELFGLRSKSDLGKLQVSSINLPSPFCSYLLDDN